MNVRAPLISSIFTNVQRFLRLESSSGIVLAFATFLAMLIANSPFNGSYQKLLATPLGPFSLLQWVNDGLMALFFFVVGMEIKHELIDGALASVERAALPVVGALGGMIAPALIFLAFNFSGEYLHAWGIPMATDIAFAVGMMSLLGRRVPQSLRIFLLALAIADDMGAVIVIALFYSKGVDLHYLLAAVALCGVIVLASMREVRWVALHVVLGVTVWFLVHRAGVHATVAGCVLGFLMPHDDLDPSDPSPLERWIGHLHPIAGFVIIPIFALANTGITFSGIEWSKVLMEPLVLGIALGLFIGKPLGIFGASWLAMKAGIAKTPEGVTPTALLGAGCMGGIGFTMAFFIASLALHSESAMTIAKVGIIGGSAASALLGSVILANRRQ